MSSEPSCAAVSEPVRDLLGALVAMPNSTSSEKKKISPTGNRTPVTRVTGGYTDHYTIEEEAMSEQASQTE